MTRRYGWGGEVQGGSAGQTSDIFYSYTNNMRHGFSYDAAGNLIKVRLARTKAKQTHRLVQRINLAGRR